MSIRKNFLYNILYQILVMMLPIITAPYISRVIGVEGVGIYSYTYSIAYYFVMLAMLGINNYGNRTIASVRDDKERLSFTFWSIYQFHVAVSFIMIVMYYIYITFLVKDNKIIYYIQFIYVLSSLLDINWLFFGLEKFKLTVTRNSIIKILTVLSVFIFVRNKNDLWIYTLIIASGTLISQLALWPFVRKYVFFKRTSIFKAIKTHFKPCLVLFVPILAISIYKIMDKIMLGSIRDMTQVGLYENSEKLINIPLTIITALGTVMLPKMSNLISNGYKNESKKYLLTSIRFAMFISIGAACGLASTSKNLVPIFLSNKFSGCINLVIILSPTIIFLGWANVIRTQYLIPNKMDEIFIKSTIIGALVNVICNLILIKGYGAIGAAIGTVFSEGIVAIYQTIRVKDQINIKLFIKQGSIFIIPGIIMYIVVSLIGSSMEVTLFTLIIQVIVGVALYCITSLLFLDKIRNNISDYLLSKLKNRKLEGIE